MSSFLTVDAPDTDRPDDRDAEGAEYWGGDVIIGKYQLVSLLGHGGMGAVWLATNTALEADVAIKLIRREQASALASRRLLREAQATARLGHPSIVRIHDFGETDRGDPFIVMEMLKGETLRDLLNREGKLPPVHAVQILLPILSGLSAAHREGIVHRDLKPGNVFLHTDGDGEIRPKLLDFGIVKHKAEPSEPPSSDSGATSARSVALRLTQAGALVGSPQYMSPEQACGRNDVDERADLWGLSVVMFEAICGRPPFQHIDYTELLMQVVSRDPTPAPDPSVCDDGLAQILARGLMKDRDKRWQSAQELGEELAQWLLAQGVDVDILGRRVTRQWLGHSGPGSGAGHTSPASMRGVDSDRFSFGPLSSAAKPEIISTPPPRGQLATGAVVAAVVAMSAAAVVLGVQSETPKPVVSVAAARLAAGAQVPLGVLAARPEPPTVQAHADEPEPEPKPVAQPRKRAAAVTAKPKSAPAPKPKPARTDKMPMFDGADF